MREFEQIVSCDCGQVKYKAVGPPIVTAVCYCSDCQDAGDMMDQIGNVKPFRESDGGTPYVTLHDKDWTAETGEGLLEPIKLKPAASTTSYVARCCGSPMFLKFERGFWVSTYRARYSAPPALEWRNKVARRRSRLPFPDNIARYKGFPLSLFGRLIKAKFRRRF